MTCVCIYLADCLHRQSLDSYRQRPNYRQYTESASYAQRPRHRYQPYLCCSYPHCSSSQSPLFPLSWPHTPTDVLLLPLFHKLPALSWCFAGRHHSTSLVSVPTTNNISTLISTHITSASGITQAHTLSPDPTRPVLNPKPDPQSRPELPPDPSLASHNRIPHRITPQECITQECINALLCHASLTCSVHVYRQSLDASQQYPSHRQSTESARPAEHTSYRQPMDPAQPDPYVTPPQYREAGPSLDRASPVRLLSYPPLRQVEARRSASNSDMGSRRAFAANLQMVEPYSNEVHRPTYTQRLAPPPRVK